MLSNALNFITASIKGFKWSVIQTVTTASICYLISSLLIDAKINDQIMFDGFLFEVDSYSYLKVGQWVLGGEATEHLAIRPYLFSLIVASLYSIGGVFLVWLYQFAIYVAAHLLLVQSVKRIATNITWVWIASFLYLINFSLVGLTYHALAEMTVVFGLSVILYMTIRNFTNQLDTSTYFSWMLFTFALMIVVKPVFTYPLILFLLFTALQLLTKKITFQKLPKWPIFGGMIAIILQLAIMQYHYHELKISLISDITYKKYLLSQALMSSEKIDRNQAIEMAVNMTKEEISSYSLKNKALLAKHFFHNLEQNIQADSFIEDYNDSSNNGIHTEIMKYYNRKVLYIHFFILFFGVYFFFRNRKILISKDIIGMFCLWGILIYYLFVTGISFDQRDRLVMGALPLWIFFFVFFAHSLFSSSRQRILKEKS